ncbi:MAG: A/G-specific adenine glycosylase [Thermomicrobiales bacterium]
MDTERLRTSLIAWFRGHGRDLPWRRTRDPYPVLVSEIMLQQIQVARAIPFYEAFLVRFPTLGHLAEAPVADVIRTWGDLGRYRRAVYLHRIARIVVDEHGGKVSADPATLRQLPGVGPYTAGAVACFAFEADVPFLDTNMLRVLHRIFLGAEDASPARAVRRLEPIAAALVPDGAGWAWNSALMDLGATVCTARKPRCAPCPVADLCAARPAFETGGVAPAAIRRTPPFRYEDSNRYYRGRVLAALRALPDDPEADLPMMRLGEQVRDGFTDGDVPWLYGVVRSLAKDGLASVAEEPAAYDAGGPDPASARVRLP